MSFKFFEVLFLSREYVFRFDIWEFKFENLYCWGRVVVMVVRVRVCCRYLYK